MLTMPAIFPSIGATFGRLSFLGDGGSSPGRTRRWRMQCACGPCNQRKAAKDEIAWANENGRLL